MPATPLQWHMNSRWSTYNLAMSEDRHQHSRKADDLWIDFFRSMTPTERVAISSSLSRDHFHGIRRALVNLFPDADLAELKLKFVQALYGQELSDRVRKGLEGERAHAISATKWCESDPGFEVARREIEGERLAKLRR